MRLGEKTLKLLREQNKKQSDLADAIGAGTSTVAGWKYENRNPSSDMIVPICKFLGISPNELLEYESLPILGNNDRATTTSRDEHFLDDQHDQRGVRLDCL
jgi:transcriptional regulator with XRE-family HTH domain